MKIFSTYITNTFIPIIVNFFKREVFYKDAQSRAPMSGVFHILKFNKALKALVYPIILIGILVVWGGIQNFIKYPESLNYSNLLILLFVILLFIFGPIWFWLFYKNYELAYNDKEIIIKRFIFKQRNILLSEIKEISFFELEGNLYITDSRGFVRVSNALIGFNDFENFVGKFKEIKRFRK